VEEGEEEGEEGLLLLVGWWVRVEETVWEGGGREGGRKRKATNE